MPENEFERHVQDKLEELKLRPSESVWHAVELELRKKKRRRAVFFIFLLAGLGLFGYSGYFLFNNSTPVIVHQSKELPAAQKPANEINDKHTDQSSAGIKTTPTDEDVKTETNEVLINNEIPALPTKITDQNLVINPQTEKRIIKKEKNIPVVVLQKENKVSKEEKTEQEIVTGKKQQKDLAQNNKREINTDNDPEEEVVVMKAIEEPVSENSIPQNSIAEQDHPIEKAVTDAADEKENADRVIAEEVAVNENGTNDAAKNKTGLKLKWGAELSGGATSSRTDPLTLVTAQRFADASSINNSVATGGNPGPVRPPSSVKGGPGFKAGVIAEIKLSKRSSISSGLRYSYLSEKIKVGRYSDTTIVSNSYYTQNIANGVYRGTQEKEHTNSYHFIELPVMYHLQLNKSTKIPILWNAGVSVAYLAGTNALVYDPTMGGIYYELPNAFNKWHFNLNTGFSFRFGNKIQWSLGPELSLDMSRLMKQELYTKKRYLLYGGLSAKLFLPQKKK